VCIKLNLETMAKKPKEEESEVEHIEQLSDKKEALLAALEKTMGSVSSACSATGIGRTTYYHWAKNDPLFAERAKDVSEIIFDKVESQIHQHIFGRKSTDVENRLDPNPTVAIFYAKTKMKHRGYVERQEVTGADGKDFVLPVPIIQISGEMHPDEK
jgi:hypothetical protein